MFDWMKRKVSEPPQPKAWAVRDFEKGCWTKAITHERPRAFLAHYVVGPFRSEVDCEEFCDHKNTPYLYRVKVVSQEKQNQA